MGINFSRWVAFDASSCFCGDNTMACIAFKGFPSYTTENKNLLSFQYKDNEDDITYRTTLTDQSELNLECDHGKYGHVGISTTHGGFANISYFFPIRYLFPSRTLLESFIITKYYHRNEITKRSIGWQLGCLGICYSLIEDNHMRKSQHRHILSSIWRSFLFIPEFTKFEEIALEFALKLRLLKKIETYLTAYGSSKRHVNTQILLQTTDASKTLWLQHQWSVDQCGTTSFLQSSKPPVDTTDKFDHENQNAASVFAASNFFSNSPLHSPGSSIRVASGTSAVFSYLSHYLIPIRISLFGRVQKRTLDEMAATFRFEPQNFLIGGCYMVNLIHIGLSSKGQLSAGIEFICDSGNFFVGANTSPGGSLKYGLVACLTNTV